MFAPIKAQANKTPIFLFLKEADEQKRKEQKVGQEGWREKS